MSVPAKRAAAPSTASAADADQRVELSVSDDVPAPTVPAAAPEVVPPPASPPPGGGEPPPALSAPPAPGGGEPPPPLDPRELDALIAELLPGLEARAMQLCRNHVDAQELIQEALARACRKLNTLRDRACVRSWLLTIISNTFIDTLRRQRSRPQTVPFDHQTDAELDERYPQLAESPEPRPWEHITTDQLHEAIEQLPEDMRVTYRMHALEGKDYVTIAATLGIPKPTVGTRLVRARKRLRELLFPDVEDTP